MKILGVDLASGSDRTVEQKILVVPPALYEHALKEYKDTGVVVMKNKPLPEVAQ